jgi:ABC-type antimicrobial peptide transport system permease subunit
MLSTFVLYSTLSVGDNVVNKYEEIMLSTYQGYDVEIKSIDSSKFKVEDTTLLDDNQESSILPIAMAMGSYNYITSDYDKDIHVVFLGTNREQLINDGLLTLEDTESDWNVTDNKQIIISNKSSEKYGIKLGDTIKITTINGDITYVVSGIADNSGYVSSEVSTYLYVYTTMNETENNSSQGNDSVLININESRSVDDYIETFNKNNTNYEATSLLNYEIIYSNVNSIRQIMTIILVCIIGMNFFVISSLIKLLLTTRVPVLGTFRSIGASKSIVNMVLLLENVIYGIIGGTLGIIIGLIFNGKIIQLFVGYDDITNVINIKYVIIALLCSIVLQIIFVLASIIKTGKIDIISSIFNKVDVSAKSSWKQFFIGMFIFAVSILLFGFNQNYDFTKAVLALLCAIIGGVLMVEKISNGIVNLVTCKMDNSPIKMGLRNVSYSKTTSTNVYLVTISLAIVLLIYLVSMSISAFFSSALNETINAEYIFSGMTDQIESYTFLQENPDIADYRVAYYKRGEVTIDNATYNNMEIVGMNEAENGIKDPDNMFNQLQDNEVLIDKIFAKKNGFDIGNSVKLTSKFLTEPIECKIVGYIDVSSFNATRECLIINQKTYFKYVDKIPTMLFINTNSVSNNVYYNLYDSAYQYNLTLVSGEEYIAEQESNFDSVLSLVYIMFVLSFILAFIGIINNLLIGFLQHQKEYAILLSNAMSKAQIKLMIFVEIVASFIISGILGGALSLWLNKLVEVVLYSINYCISGEINIGAIIMVIVIALIMLSFTFFVPARQLNKMDIVSQIKGEE